MGTDHDERTTGDLLLVLESDYKRCYSLLLARIDEGERLEGGSVSADYEFEARQLFRAAFAYIEGATYILKMEAIFNCEEKGIELTPQQRHLIFEADFDLNEKGKVIKRRAKISLLKNIRFAFAVFAEANGIISQFNPSEEWWFLLRKAILVRDRLMHPRDPSDLDVTPAETTIVVRAKAGFDEVLYSMLQASRI